MNILPTKSELLDFASKFLKERTQSLRKDVKGCVKHTYPFPGLLYSFSSIDLLGGLYRGDATGDTRKYGKSVGTTVKAKNYMITFMQYPNYEAGLLQNIFRHKVVHLAQPKTVIFDKSNNRFIAWKLINTSSKNHLKLEKFTKSKSVITLTPYKMTCDYALIISLARLTNDIISSVHRKPDGYFESLKSSLVLQNKFRNAIRQIYDPKI